MSDLCHRTVAGEGAVVAVGGGGGGEVDAAILYSTILSHATALQFLHTLKRQHSDNILNLTESDLSKNR